MTGLREWREMRPRVKIAGMLSIAAVGLVAAVFCVSTIGARAMAEEESARREMEVLYQLQRLQTAAVTASAQIRGYFLTGDEGFTAGIREAVTAFDEGLKTLHTRLSQTSHRLADAQKIAVLEASREERIYGTMARFRSHAISPQELRTVLRSAEEERQAIGARLLKIQVEANRLSGEHLALRDRLSSAARVTAWSCALLLIALLAAVWGVFDSGVMAGMGRLKEQVARLDAAGRMNPAALGRGELQVMAETVGRGAELLDEQTRLLDRAVHGIARLDPAGHFLSHNRAFGELLGVAGMRMSPINCWPVFTVTIGRRWKQPERLLGRARARKPARGWCGRMGPQPML